MNEEYAEQEIDLSVLLVDFFGVFRRFWWLIVVLTMLISSALGIYEKLTYVPAYQASATFTVYVVNPFHAGITGYNAKVAEQLAKTFPHILTSQALQTVVKQELDIPSMPPVSASVQNSTNIFTLSVRADSPELAYQVLDSVIDHYPDIAEVVVGPTTMSLLDESGIPTSPCNQPRYLRSVKIGILAGTGLALAFMVLLAMLRHSIHEESELKEIVHTPCLGLIPMTKSSRSDGGGLIPKTVEGDVHHGFQEAVSLMRMRVDKELQRTNKKVLLISSASAGEGKSTVAASLATAMAQHNHKVLLIDCDLRSPKLTQSMGYDGKTGLSEVLLRKAEAWDCIIETQQEGLHILPSGTPVKNAAELLGRKELVKLIAEAREQYTYIILDTPPASLLADAAVISAVADASLYVVRQNYASKTQIMDGIEVLADGGLPLLGCVMNCTSAHGMSGYGSYYYSSKYHYYESKR